MQRLFISSLSSLILLASTTVATAVRAEITAINSNNLPNHSARLSYLQPFNLVHLAYQGEFKRQGIPSGNSLILEYQIGKITEIDLVKAAVNANKLPTQILTDKSYLNTVELQLASLLNNSNY